MCSWIQSTRNVLTFSSMCLIISCREAQEKWWTLAKATSVTDWIQCQIVGFLPLVYTSQGNCSTQYIVFSLGSTAILIDYIQIHNVFMCVVVNWLNLYCTHASACARVPRQLREVFEVRRSNIPTPLVSPHYQFVFHLSPRDLSPGLKMLVKTVC